MMNNKFNYAEATLEDFQNAITHLGWVVYENALDPELIKEIQVDLVEAYYIRRQVQIENGIETHMEGTLHHILERDNFGINFLKQMFCDQEMRHFLGGNYILNGMSGVINMKNERPYVQNVHRDIRSFTGEIKQMIQMIVLLDDFTIDNGATHLLSGSHKIESKPDDEYFYRHAERAIAKKGSLILFDSNLWHAAGVNNTDKPRRVLTLSFTRPYFKPQFDFPRFLGYKFGATLNEDLRQVIGYNARIPANLEEFYQPVHLRMYQPGQG